MRATILSLAVLLATTSSAHAEPVPLKPLPVLKGLRGKFEVRTQIQRVASEGPGKLPRLQLSRVGRVLFDTKILASLAEALNQRVVLEQNVSILSQPCGQANAFYDADTHTVTLCDELFQELEGLFSHMGEGPAFNEAVLGATVFFVLHEVGHALVHQFGVPLLAREEDAVDGIAAYLTLSSGIPNAAFAGANSFAFMAAKRQAGAPIAFWDEHSIHEQRFFNIACWIYGSSPGTYGFLVQTNMLPQRRAVRCSREYAQLTDGVVRLLGSHLTNGR